MENITSSLLNIKELMEDNLRRFDVVEQHLKELRESHNKMHQVFQQSIEDFTTNIQESFNEFDAQICEIQEEDVVAGEEKDEIKPAQLFLSYVPKNLEPFLPFSNPSLRISCPSLPPRNYFPFSSFHSVVPSTNYTVTIKEEDLAIRWEFDPGGIDFLFLDSSPSPQNNNHTIDLSYSHFSASLRRANPRKKQAPTHTSLVIEWKQIYEECFQRRREQNTERMEELNLGKLAQALKGPSSLYSSVFINGTEFCSNLLQDCRTCSSAIHLGSLKLLNNSFDELPIIRYYSISAIRRLTHRLRPQKTMVMVSLTQRLLLLSNSSHTESLSSSLTLAYFVISGLDLPSTLNHVDRDAVASWVLSLQALPKNLRGKKSVAPLVLDVLLLRGVFEPFDRGKIKEMGGNHFLNKTLNNVFHLFYLDFDVNEDGEIHVNFADSDDEDEEPWYGMDFSGMGLDLPLDPNEPTDCLCNQVSYGEMVACDNPNCKIEWFHFGCVGLKEQLKGKWRTWLGLQVSVNTNLAPQLLDVLLTKGAFKPFDRGREHISVFTLFNVRCYVVSPHRCIPLSLTVKYTDTINTHPFAKNFRVVQLPWVNMITRKAPVHRSVSFITKVILRNITGLTYMEQVAYISENHLLEIFGFFMSAPENLRWLALVIAILVAVVRDQARITGTLGSKFVTVPIFSIVVEWLIAWKNMNINRYMLNNSTTGEIFTKYLGKEQEAYQGNTRDYVNSAELEAQEKFSLLKWVANERGFVTNKSQEDFQFSMPQSTLEMTMLKIM
ncbi:uncharacterized protein LOC118348476 [Juglans regia]|uniref:Uncharacterized protein LOC118348476 n=1 Tax=Juglans regia TaxID=51240 RepID=A0A6P9EF82_JUGRE|nr:uncharacterized protein LOC118348476 [Juglans regia]